MQYISILPEGLDVLRSEHRYLRLPHPRTGQPQLYLPNISPEGVESVYEVIKVSGGARRTWFIGEDDIQSGGILIHHKIDPLFLVVPMICHLVNSPLSDLISSITSSAEFAVAAPFAQGEPSGASPSLDTDMGRLLRLKSVRRAFELCCDRKVIPGIAAQDLEDGDNDGSSSKKQVYYRPSHDRIITHLRAKVDHVAHPERFEQFDHMVRSLNRDGLYDAAASAEMTHAARTRNVIDHISQYLPTPTTSALAASYDFASLEEYLSNRAAAVRAAQQPIVNPGKETKGTKRKALPASRGVESLKKVNTSKMNKLTSFFKPKEEKK